MLSKRKQKKLFGEDSAYMAGTEGTGEYAVVALSELGRVGVRGLGSGDARIRVEPTAKSLELLAGRDGWKQPGDDGQKRYSKVVCADDLTASLTLALAAIAGPGVDVRDTEYINVAGPFKTRAGLRRVLWNAGVKPKATLCRYCLCKLIAEKYG